MIEIVLLIILTGIAIFIICFVSYFTPPENKVMEEWTSYDEQAVKEYQAKQNWYVQCLN